MDAIKELVPEAAQARACAHVTAQLQELRDYLQGVSCLREFSGRTMVPTSSAPSLRPMAF